MAKSRSDSKTQSDSPGRYAYDGLERLLHERSRLSIMTCLITHRDGLLFNDVKKQCAMTDGNLNRHLDALFRAGYIEVWKKEESTRSQTLFRVTATGRKEFLAYLQELERVIQDAQPASKRGTDASPLPGWRLGWTE